MLYNGAPARAAAHGGASVIAVEGYIDVIAMVTAGFAATVAPLGTALTEDQLALLWKLADEPILCFDGDSAGRRAAYRAVDLALPRLKPGKSVRFALLPEGQDPDDLVRSGGRAAMLEVLNAAWPLGDMLWARETEAGAFDTPERRAALEARIGAVMASIGDDSVRKHYRQDFEQRLRQLFAPAPRAQQGGREQRFDRQRTQSGRRDAQFAGKRSGWSDSASPSAAHIAEPASVHQFDRARNPQLHADARSADPGRGHQSFVAAGHPCGGILRARVPASRCRPVAPRHPRCRRRPRPI